MLTLGIWQLNQKYTRNGPTSWRRSSSNRCGQAHMSGLDCSCCFGHSDRVSAGILSLMMMQAGGRALTVADKPPPPPPVIHFTPPCYPSDMHMSFHTTHAQKWLTACLACACAPFCCIGNANLFFTHVNLFLCLSLLPESSRNVVDAVTACDCTHTTGQCCRTTRHADQHSLGLVT